MGGKKKSSYPIVETLKDERGGLHAASVGDVDRLRRLAAEGWSVDTVDRHGSTALMWACGAGHVAAARWLVQELGAPVERGNKDGRTALMWAVRNGELGAARWLIDDAGADVRATNKNGTTMLHWAIWGESVAAVAFVLERTGEDVNVPNAFGCTAAHWASTKGSVELCRFFEEERGLRWGLVNKAGHSPLHKAAWYGHAELLRWLLVGEHRAALRPLLALRDSKQRCCVALAEENGHAELAAELRRDWGDWLHESQRTGRSGEAEGAAAEGGFSPIPMATIDGQPFHALDLGVLLGGLLCPFLAPADVLRSATVSRGWRTAVDAPHLWWALLGRHFGLGADALRRIGRGRAAHPKQLFEQLLRARQSPAGAALALALINEQPRPSEGQCRALVQAARRHFTAQREAEGGGVGPGLWRLQLRLRRLSDLGLRDESSAWWSFGAFQCRAVPLDSAKLGEGHSLWALLGDVVVNDFFLLPRLPAAEGGACCGAASAVEAALAHAHAIVGVSGSETSKDWVVAQDSLGLSRPGYRARSLVLPESRRIQPEDEARHLTGVVEGVVRELCSVVWA